MPFVEICFVVYFLKLLVACGQLCCTIILITSLKLQRAFVCKDIFIVVITTLQHYDSPNALRFGVKNKVKC